MQGLIHNTLRQKRFLKLHFISMSLCFACRDFLLPPKNILREAGIENGFYVLDYGCGPGSYLVPLVDMVQEKGKIYALDICPFAIKRIEKIISKRHLKNAQSIHSDCETGLPDKSIDTVLLYDTFHALDNPDDVLRELHRVLKPGGILSFRDHHMRNDTIVAAMTNSGLFRFLNRGKRTCSFNKNE
jgi:ubiquinone/menaquinone biosynthesis C-methylase UbiE